MSRVRSNRICFTLNNPTTEDIEEIEYLVDKNDKSINYLVVGNEIGENGTNHLQGFIRIEAKPKDCGVNFWRNYFKFGKRAHFESARGTDDQNKEYCQKEGRYISLGDPLGPAENCFKIIYETAKTSIEDAIAIDYEFGIKNYNAIKGINEASKITRMEYQIDLREWQKVAIEMLKNQNDRQILFIVDEVGGKGKSVLTKWIMSNMNAWPCNGELFTTSYLTLDLTAVLVK